jgi:hypothetical protein
VRILFEGVDVNVVDVLAMDSTPSAACELSRVIREIGHLPCIQMPIERRLRLAPDYEVRTRVA